MCVCVPVCVFLHGSAGQGGGGGWALGKPTWFWGKNGGYAGEVVPNVDQRVGGGWGGERGSVEGAAEC